MSNYAKGKHAMAISDRSGMAFPYNEMIKEWNGMFVHKSEYESKHPQLDSRAHKADSVSLQNARPARIENSVPNLLKTDSFKTGTSGTSAITVTEISHGRSSGDTVRFREVAGFDGITPSNINRSAGYTITKVDADTYTFTVSTDTATTGSTNGGSYRAYAGPVTITA